MPVERFWASLRFGQRGKLDEFELKFNHLELTQFFYGAMVHKESSWFQIRGKENHHSIIRPGDKSARHGINYQLIRIKLENPCFEAELIK